MEFEEILAARYSVRKFKDQPVEDEKLKAILAVVPIAPTACNNQPQKVYVLRSKEAREKLKSVCPCTFDAPIVFVIAYDEKQAARGRIKPHYQFGETDAAITCTHMMLEAQNLGLGSCWVGWFRGDEVAQVLGLPEGIQVSDILPVGYPADDAAPAVQHTKSRPTDEMIFEL